MNRMPTSWRKIRQKVKTSHRQAREKERRLRLHAVKNSHQDPPRRLPCHRDIAKTKLVQRLRERLSQQVPKASQSVPKSTRLRTHEHARHARIYKNTRTSSPPDHSSVIVSPRYDRRRRAAPFSTVRKPKQPPAAKRGKLPTRPRDHSAPNSRPESSRPPVRAAETEPLGPLDHRAHYQISSDTRNQHNLHEFVREAGPDGAFQVRELLLV